MSLNRLKIRRNARWLLRLTALTQPLADFIAQNFTVKTQEIAPSESFSAVVWEGKSGTGYTEMA